jgi:hypothetical protein
VTQPRDGAPDDPLEPMDDEAEVDAAAAAEPDSDAETEQAAAEPEQAAAEMASEPGDVDDADLEVAGELGDDEGADEADELEEVDDEDAEDEDLDAAGEAEIDDYDAAIREVAGEAVPAAAIPTARRQTSAERRAVGTSTVRAPSPSEIAVHVKENVSRYYVIAAVAVFVIIYLNALLLGTGGLLRPLATPTAIPTESPSASPSASGSASASPSAAESASASPSAASPVASPSAAPSGSPAASAS